jgi:hypothetical protein
MAQQPGDFRRSQSGLSRFEVFSDEDQRWKNFPDDLIDRVPEEILPATTAEEKYPLFGHFNQGALEALTFGAGSGRLKDFMRQPRNAPGFRGGIAVASDQPEGVLETSADVAGRTLGLLPGMLLASRRAALAPVGSITREIGRTISNPYLQKPWSTGAIELAAGAGAGAGEAMTEGTPASTVGGTIGAFAGGVLPAVSRLAISPLSFLSRPLIRGIRNRGQEVARQAREHPMSPMAPGFERIPTAQGDDIINLTPGLTSSRAAEQIQGRVLGPGLARRDPSSRRAQGFVQNLQTPTVSPYTSVGVQSRDPSIIALERQVRERLGPESSERVIQDATDAIVDLTQKGQTLSLEGGTIADLGSPPLGTRVRVAPGGRTQAPAGPPEWGLTEGMIQPLKAPPPGPGTRVQVPDRSPTGGPGRYGSTAIDEALERAQVSAQRQAAQIAPDSPQAQISSVLSDDLSVAFTNLKSQEDELWEAAREAGRGADGIDTTNLGQKLRQIIDDVPKAQQELIPQFVRRILPPDVPPGAPTPSLLPGEQTPNLGPGQFDIKEAPFQIQGALTQARQVQRDAKLRGNLFEADIAGSIATVLKNELDQVPGDLYGRARNFSNTVHDFWDRNPLINKVFDQTGRSGVPDIALNPTAVIDRLGIGKGERIAANTIRDVLDVGAFSGTSQPRSNTNTVSAISDYLRQEFLEASDNLVSLEKATNFMKKHEELWSSRFPELVPLGRELRRSIQLAESENAAASLRQNARTVLSAERPLSAYNSLVQLRTPGLIRSALARSDEDKKLWRTAIFDVITRDQTGETAGRIRQDAGQRLLGMLDESGSPYTWELLKEVYTAPEIARLKLIGSELAANQALLTPDTQALGFIPGSKVLESNILGALLGVVKRGARFTGAAIGGRVYGMGGAPTLQGGAAGSQISATFVDNAADRELFSLLTEAFEDPALLSKLFTSSSKLNSSSFRELLGIVRKHGGPLLLNNLRSIGIPSAVAAAKAKIPTTEEQQELLNSMGQSFAPVDALGRFGPRTSSIGQREITPVPPQPQGPRIGSPRR